MWVHKAPIKELEFDLEHAKETFLEAKKSFMEASTLGSQDHLEPKMDPSMINTFLENCMKLLCNRKVVKGLQDLITRCAGSREPCIVQKLRKYTS